MTSPDFRPYVDLTIYDQQPGDIYNDAIEYGQLALPEFTARAGTVEDALLQAMSYVSGQTIAAMNRLPNGLMEGVLRLLGFNRIEATFATTTLYFTAIDEDGLSIPAGTKIGYTETIEGGIVQHIFETLTTATISPGSDTSTSVTIQATEAGEKPALLSGQEMVILTASNRLYQAFLDADLEQGAATETDAEYFARGATYFASLSTGLITNEQIQAYVAQTYLNATRVKVYDLTNVVDRTPTSINRSGDVVTAVLGSGHGVVGTDVVRLYGAAPSSFNGVFTAASVSATEIFYSQVASNASVTAFGQYQNLNEIEVDEADKPGYITIFVCGEGGASLTAEEKDAIKDDVDLKTVAGLSVAVHDALIIPTTITLDIKVKAGFNTLTVSDAVEQYLTSLVSPDQWDWSNVVRKNALIARVSQISGVDYVDAFSFTLDASEPLGEINGTTGDLEFFFRGTLPLATVTASVI